MRLSLTVTSAAGPAPSTAPRTDAPVDRVTLSPEAATTETEESGAATSETSQLPAAASTPSVPPPSRSARRADALFTALDGDKDGAITEAEFTEGALNLLRNAGARRRIDDDGDGERREARGLRRLERRLEKAFDHVDRNDDGAIDKNELTAALSRGRGRRGGPDASPADALPPEIAAGGVTSVSISVTYVSIAVQRYTSVQNSAALAASEPEASGVNAPATDTSEAPERDAETPALAA